MWVCLIPLGSVLPSVILTFSSMEICICSQVAVHRVAKSRTQLSDWTELSWFHSCLLNYRDLWPTQWTWVWVSSGSWWWTGKPGVLPSMGLQRVGHDWLNLPELSNLSSLCPVSAPFSPRWWCSCWYNIIKYHVGILCVFQVHDIRQQSSTDLPCMISSLLLASAEMLHWIHEAPSWSLQQKVV